MVRGRRPNTRRDTRAPDKINATGTLGTSTMETTLTAAITRDGGLHAEGQLFDQNDSAHEEKGGITSHC